jgi:membrane protein required for colicin V production
MTPFDWILLGVIALSTLFAFFRGVIRELIAIVAWIAGIVGAIVFTPVVAEWLPQMSSHPTLRYIVAFALIIIVALVLGALIAWPLTRAVRAAGLGFVDRFLGALFGLARGLIAVLAFALVAGLTTIPRSDWWHNSALAPVLVTGVMLLSPHLPPAWTAHLDYSRDGHKTSAAPRKA